MNENNNINIKNNEKKIIGKLIDKKSIEYSINNENDIYPQDTIINIQTNKEKIQIKDDNIKSTILQTNNIKRDSYNEEEDDKIENKKLEYDDYEKDGDFFFINISDKVKPFIYKPQKNNEYTSHAFNNFHFLAIVHFLIINKNYFYCLIN